MPSTMDQLVGDLGHLELNSGENEKNLMKKTFRELRERALSYDEKEPNSAKAKADFKSSNKSKDSEEDSFEPVNNQDSDSEDDGLELVKDYEESSDEEICVVEKCGKDAKPKTQNRDTPYNVPNRLGGVIQQLAQIQSAASRFFSEREYKNALPWLIDAKNMHFDENCIIEQLGKLKNSIDQSNRNKYSQFYKIFCEPNHEEVTALFYASIHNKTRITEFLVKEIFQNGFSSPQQAMNYFNKQDPAGNTLLHEMAYVGDIVSQTLAKLLEFRYPDARHTLFNYKMKNSNHQSPIHYSLKNCLQNSQYKTIEIFHTVDPDILKTVDGKGNNLLHCFIQSCKKLYPLHATVDSKGLDNVKQCLKQLLSYPEINSYGCLELLNMHQQDMEPSVWAKINTFLGGAKIENNQTKPDDEIQVMFSSILPIQKKGIERKTSQEKQTPVVLGLRDEKITPQSSVQEDMENDMIPVFVTDRSLDDIYEDTTKNKKTRSKGSSRKSSRHSSKDDGYLTGSSASLASSISPGTSPQQASTSAKTYSGMNVSTSSPIYPPIQHSSISQSYMYTQEVNSIPLSVQDISSPGLLNQSNLQSGKYTYPQIIPSSTPTQNKSTSLRPLQSVQYTTTNSIIVQNSSKIGPKPFTNMPKATIFSQRSPAPTPSTTFSQMATSPIPYSQIPPTPSSYSQMSPAQTVDSQISHSPNTYSQIPTSPNTYSQISTSPNTYSQMPTSPNTYSQIPTTPVVYTQMPVAPMIYTQLSPRTAYSKIPPSPNTQPIYSATAPTYSPICQIPPSPNTQPIYPPAATTYPQTIQNVPTESWNTIPMVLKLLPATACPDASEVLEVIKGTWSPMQTVIHQECPTSYFQCNTCDQTFPTKQQLLSHAQQVHNMTAGKETVEILIDQASLSEAGKQPSDGAQPFTTNDLDGLLTTQDFDDFLDQMELNNVNTEEKEEDSSIPDLEGLLSTPQVEKGPFSFSTRK